jgi:uncharacterized protein YjcR
VVSGVLVVGLRAAYAAGVDDLVTPRQLAEELGLSDRTVRQWLRDQGWQGVPYTRWRLTDEQAAQVRNHFRRLG